MDNLQEAYLNVYGNLDEAAKRIPPKVRGAKDPQAHMAGRSDAGKRISGDQDTGPRYYTLGRARGANVDAPTQPGQKPVGTPKLANWEKDDIQYRKANLRAGKVHKVGGEKGLPEEREYNELLKFLYFEGYAESYAEAEELLESMSDEEFEDLLERKYDRDETLPSGRTPRQNMERQRGRHGANYLLRKREPGVGRNDQAADSHFSRASTMDTVKKAQDAGEEPRDSSAWKNTIAARRRPRASYEVPNERPGGLRAKATKAGGYRTLVRKEETEMQEAWYSGKGTYRTTASGRKVRWDEDEATDDAVSALMQKRREAAAKKAAQARMKAKGTVPKKGGNEMFESIVEYLFVEGYADTIQNAELMAENISEGWVNEIMEAAKDQSDKQIDQGVKKTYKAGNVLDNLHQGRSKGINKLDPRERDAKVKRMRARLKARRDDLFKERDSREDAKRAELKKLLGL